MAVASGRQVLSATEQFQNAHPTRFHETHHRMTGSISARAVNVSFCDISSPRTPSRVRL